MKKTFLITMFALSVAFSASNAHAVMYNWTDWTSSSPTNGFTAVGTMTTTTTTVDVTYNNPTGVGFFQNGVTGNIVDYFAQGPSGSLGRDASTSPFTSTTVDNIPTAAEMIALRYRGIQSLTFSQTIANPVFAFVSLNGNGYAFDQDFEILSLGGVDGNDCGYWGCGGASKVVVDLGGGNFEYQLNSNNAGGSEPHGTLRFTGAFDEVSWRSTSNEYWNGFTVGIEGTEEEVFHTNAVPEPATMALFGTGLVGAFIRRKFLG